MKAIAGLLWIGLLGAQAAMAGYEVGDTVTDFTLPDVDGREVRLSDYSGRLILLNFWDHG